MRVLFGKTHFILGNDDLSIEREIFGWRRRKTYDKKSVTAVRQIRRKDPEDSIPGWDLIVEEDTDDCLLSGQSREQCEWLGRIVAGWASVRYVPWDEPRRTADEIDKPAYG